MSVRINEKTINILPVGVKLSMTDEEEEMLAYVDDLLRETFSVSTALATGRQRLFIRYTGNLAGELKKQLAILSTKTPVKAHFIVIFADKPVDISNIKTNVPVEVLDVSVYYKSKNKVMTLINKLKTKLIKYIEEEIEQTGVLPPTKVVKLFDPAVLDLEEKLKYEVGTALKQGNMKGAIKMKLHVVNEVEIMELLDKLGVETHKITYLLLHDPNQPHEVVSAAKRLLASGYTVIIVHSPEELIEYVESFPYAIIVYPNESVKSLWKGILKKQGYTISEDKFFRIEEV